MYALEDSLGVVQPHYNAPQFNTFRYYTAIILAPNAYFPVVLL